MIGPIEDGGAWYFSALRPIPHSYVKLMYVLYFNGPEPQPWSGTLSTSGNAESAVHLHVKRTKPLFTKHASRKIYCARIEITAAILHHASTSAISATNAGSSKKLLYTA